MQKEFTPPTGAALEEAIAPIRAAVLERIVSERGDRRRDATRRLPTRRRAIRRAGFVAAGAGAVAAALLVAGVVSPPGPGHGAEAEAAVLLHRAAATTITTSDPVVRPGQYLRIATTTVDAAEILAPGPEVVYLNPTSGVLYIPSDRSKQWVWVRHQLPITTVFGTAAQRARVPLGPRPADPDLDGTLRADAGAFYGAPAEDYRFASQPRDPHALLAALRKQASGHGVSQDEEVWTLITDELRTGQVPADLRAALYQAAALIPGIHVIGTDVALDGRRGEAIGLVNKDERSDIVIDPATGLLIGERDVALTAFDGVPAGTTTGWSSVSTSVVDTAP